MVRLIWFRAAFMPDWLRMALLTRLDVPSSDRIRILLADILSSVATEPAAPLVLQIAIEKPLARWKMTRIIRRLIRDAPDRSPLRDHVFLQFLSGRRLDRLTPVAPRALLDALFYGGHSWLGWRSTVMLLAAGILSTVLTFWLPPFLPEQQTGLLRPPPSKSEVVVPSLPTKATNDTAPSPNASILELPENMKRSEISDKEGRKGTIPKSPVKRAPNREAQQQTPVQNQTSGAQNLIPPPKDGLTPTQETPAQESNATSVKAEGSNEGQPEASEQVDFEARKADLRRLLAVESDVSRVKNAERETNSPELLTELRRLQEQLSKLEGRLESVREQSQLQQLADEVSALQSKRNSLLGKIENAQVGSDVPSEQPSKQLGPEGEIVKQPPQKGPVQIQSENSDPISELGGGLANEGLFQQGVKGGRQGQPIRKFEPPQQRSQQGPVQKQSPNQARIREPGDVEQQDTSQEQPQSEQGVPNLKFQPIQEPPPSAPSNLRVQ
jgi:hypothetical protein